jgi:hypothetical protein
MVDFYVISAKHTNREHQYITLWRPEDKGYAWPLSWAGRYTEQQIVDALDYYHCGENVAIPCRVLDAMAVPVTPGTVDNDAGPVVLNNKVNWLKIMQHLSTFDPKPLRYPKPQFKGARRPKEQHHG